MLLRFIIFICHNLMFLQNEKMPFFRNLQSIFVERKKDTLPSLFRSRKAQNDVKPNDAGVVDISGVRRDAGRISQSACGGTFRLGTDAFSQKPVFPVYPTTFPITRRAHFPIYAFVAILFKYRNIAKYIFFSYDVQIVNVRKLGTFADRIISIACYS